MNYSKTLNTLLVSTLALTFCASSFAQLMHNPSLGIAFSENLGQFPDHVKYVTPFAAGYIYLEDSGLTIKLYDKGKVQELHQRKSGEITDNFVAQDFYQMKFIGAQKPVASGFEQQSWYTNFYLGDDPSRWVSHAGVYSKVEFDELYPGIDLEFLGEYNNFKYNIKVAPGADLGQMQWEYSGVQSIDQVHGELVVQTAVGPMYEMKPIAWQFDEHGSKELVSCHYVLEGNTVHFHCPNGYDESRELIVDPVLVFSSYSGSTSDNWGFTATFDLDEYAYGGGIVAGAGYPTTDGAMEENFQGGSWDVGLIKFAQDGSALEYASYLGGSGSDSPSSLVADGDELLVLGFTESGNFPTTAGVLYEDFVGGSGNPGGPVAFTGGTDIFVSRFANDGSALEASTYVGGTGNDGVNQNLTSNYGDQYRSEILADSNGDVYVMSNTTSDDFPFSQGAFQQSLNGSQDAVAFKLSSDLEDMIWGTYFGGSNNDSGYSLELAPDGTVYAVGSTQSNDLDLVAPGYSDSWSGGFDGYIIQLDGNQVIAGSYVGTGSYDQCFFVETDIDGAPWVTGQSEGDMPVVGDVYSNAGAGQYLHKYSPDLATLELATTYGDGGGFFSPINICQTAFLIDNCNRIFVSGWGGALNGFGDTDDMPTTADAYQSTTDGSDFYVIVLDENASGLLFGSFMGANNLSEHVDGGTSRFSPKGIIYQAVCAGCGGSDNFPTTDGAWSEVNNSSNCNMAVFKYDLEIQSLQAVATANPEAVGCAPFEVQFSNAGSTGVEDFWDFGDGGATSTDPNPTWTYDEPGDYEVTYISTDETTCNISDTTTIQIIVGDSLDLNPAFTYLSDPCQIDPLLQLTYTGGSEYDELIWDMGDGNEETGTSVDYIYDAEGEYDISLTVTDEFCDWEIVLDETVEVLEANVNAVISADVTEGCAPLDVNFSSAGSTGINPIWYFGNGESVQDSEGSTTYPNGNEWEVMFIIQEDNGPCYDTAWIDITTINPIVLQPVFNMIPPLCSDSLLVTVNYIGGEYSSLIFDLGDGSTTTDLQFDHTYDVPGFYTITVTITDDECDQEESFEQIVEVDEVGGVIGEIKWPNVISPNHDLWNRFLRPFIVTPDGERIVPKKTELDDIFDVFELQIYNRWGNLIYEGHSAEPFWDGFIGANESEDGTYYFIARWQLACGESDLEETAGYFEVLRK